MPSSSTVTASPIGAVQAGVRGTYVAFIGSGFAFASWASRIPQVRDHLSLSPAELGLVLLCIAAGSLLALPLSGPVVHRFGSRRTVAGMAVLLAVGLATVAVGYLAGLVPVVVGLFLLGFANGAWDVAMNVQGALVERQLGRSIMSRFHAGYSVGTVPVRWSGRSWSPWECRSPRTCWWSRSSSGWWCRGAPAASSPTRPASAEDDRAGRSAQCAGGLAGAAHPADRHLRAGLRLRRGHRQRLDQRRHHRRLPHLRRARHAGLRGVPGRDDARALVRPGPARPATAGCRWSGCSPCSAIAGTLLFVFAPATPLAFAGAVLWGLGVSLGFPVGMSAGADEPRYAAGRVSVIASIGYCAFLAGPPTVGFLGDHVTVLRALTSVAVLLGLAALITAVVAPPAAQGVER